MSSFQLNLSNLTLGAKERIARLDAAGGAFHSLLSPPPLSAAAVASGSDSLPAPPLAPGGRLSVEQLVPSGAGVSGESFVSGGPSSGGLLVFVVTPELHASLCCGSVAGGVKFCTLGADACTFTTHSKKVEVLVNSLYVSTGRNSAFSHHHVPVGALSQDQLDHLLEESHSKEEWVRLFWSFNHGLSEESSGGKPRGPGAVSILDTATPGRKRKVRYDEDASAMVLFTPAKVHGEERSGSFDTNLVILPSEDSADLAPEEKLTTLWAQWNTMAGVVNRLGASLHNLRRFVAEDVEEVNAKVIHTEARLGEMPKGVGFDDCGTVWEGLQLLNQGVRDAADALTPARATLTRGLRELEEKMTEGLRGAEEARRLAQQRVERETQQLQVAMLDIANALQTLSAEQEKLTESVIQVSLGGRTSQGQQPELKHLSTRMSLLEARLPNASSGRLGGDSFQSRADVALFVEEHVPSNCFYLFHDVVTLMEALTTSHVERKDVLDEWYRSTKVGVNEASARHMASFRLILPSVFGRAKEGSAASAKHHLPSVRSFKEWNTFDGVSGVKSFIASGMEDLKYQFRQDIDHAMDMATHTKGRFCYGVK